MNGWMDRWTMYGWMNRRMGGWTNGYVDGTPDARMDYWMVGKLR